jgi:hypothetical protein
MTRAPMTVEERVRKASAARVEKARIRRYQGYLREMRRSGLKVVVIDAPPGELAAYAADPAAWPQEDGTTRQ